MEMDMTVGLDISTSFFQVDGIDPEVGPWSTAN